LNALTAPTELTRFTFSAWVKRASRGQASLLSSANVDIVLLVNTTSPQQSLVVSSTAAGHNWSVTAAGSFVDETAWTHVVVSVNSRAQAAANRVQIFLNGVLQAHAANGGPAIQDPSVGTVVSPLEIGGQLRIPGNSTPQGAPRNELYLADVTVLDGVAADASAFGALVDGVWQPREYTGPRGPAGFHLAFGNPLVVGEDAWGGPPLDSVGFSSEQLVLDHPTRNFATWHSLDRLGMNLNDGNLTIASFSSTGMLAASSFMPSHGRYYVELTEPTGGNIPYTACIGLAGPLTKPGDPYTRDASTWCGDGTLHLGATPRGTLGGLQGTLRLAFDLDVGGLWLGDAQGWSSEPGVGPPTLAFPPGPAKVAAFGSVPTGLRVNFGQGGTTGLHSFPEGDFQYAPPPGFKALSSADIPPAEILDGRRFFSTRSYTGTNVAQGVPFPSSPGFRVDLLWVKMNANGPHAFFDTARGPAVYWGTLNGTPETLDPQSVTSFESSPGVPGLLLPAGGTFNAPNAPYITAAWTASPESGLSMVTWTGNGAAQQVLPHSLGQAPDVILAVPLGAAGGNGKGWVFHAAVPNAQNSALAVDVAQGPSSGPYWGATLPTASTLTVGGPLNAIGVRGMAYVWRSVPGYSAFGTYEGGADLFVHVGFRPRWLLVRTATSSDDWHVLGAGHDPDDLWDRDIYLERQTGENAWGADVMEVTADGFSVRHNALTHPETYVYWAFGDRAFQQGRGN
jgi:hypothetical protein